jgi:hypothetical protein
MKPNIGGWHTDPAVRSGYEIDWPCGSIFANEGQRLYDLVTEHRPKLVVEVGAYYGCSTTWIASALRDNKKGKLISIDLGVYGETWKLIPEDLKYLIDFRKQDAFICEVPKNIDILFEDGMHSDGFTKTVLTRFKAPIVVCHDFCHIYCKPVQKEFRELFGEPDEVFFQPPSDCGLGIKYVNTHE